MTENTIEGLRVQQWGVEGVRATSTLTLGVIPTAAKTLIIGGRTYTFRASGDTDTYGEVSIGANVGEAQVNLRAAINGNALNPANERVSCAAFAGNAAVVTAHLPGTAGNSLAFTGTYTDDAGNSATAFANGAFARGTAVAATSKIAIEKLEWGDDDENLYRPSFATGLLIRNRGDASAVQHGTRFSFGDQPVVWEQLMHWLTMAVEGDPSVVWDNSALVYRWTFTRDPAANPSPLSWTLQRRFSDGLGNNVDQRATYCLLSELGMSWAQNEHLRLSGGGFARKFSTSAITAALALPSAELGVSALSTVYANDTWGAVGTSLLAEQVIGWDLRVGAGAMPLHTAEGRTDLDYTKHQYNAAEVQLGLNLTLLLDPTTYAAESAKAAAGDIRAIQIKVAGAGGRLMKINGLYQYTKPALFKIGEQDGQDIVEIELEEATDQTNFFQWVVEHPTVYSVA